MRRKRIPQKSKAILIALTINSGNLNGRFININENNKLKEYFYFQDGQSEGEQLEYKMDK